MILQDSGIGAEFEAARMANKHCSRFDQCPSNLYHFQEVEVLAQQIVVKDAVSTNPAT